MDTDSEETDESPSDSRAVRDDAAEDRETFECEAVGVVHTPFERREDAPRQGKLASARGEIRVDPAYEEALAGIESGDDVEVFWYADRADRSVRTVSGHGNWSSPRGVFASRSQDRPTPVCVTRCRVLSVEGTRLLVAGVDMLDGTPVLDLKAPLTYDD
ncbi:MAG: tRNA (N6-threonylcarbamoyladenosine(37)-N6)-methyltransferase TrmO [Haloferacaceae archaeon]